MRDTHARVVGSAVDDLDYVDLGLDAVSRGAMIGRVDLGVSRG